MDAKTLATLRPRDDSAGAIQVSMRSVSHQRAAAVQRRDLAHANRRKALTDLEATPKDVASFKTHAREADLEIERLNLIEGALEQRFRAATQQEDVVAKQAAIEDARVEYAAAVEEFRAAMPDYVTAAAVIVGVCELERAQLAALTRFQNAVVMTRPLGSFRPPGDPDPGVEGVNVDLARRVALPGASPHAPMIWKVEPPPVDYGAARSAAYDRRTGF